MKKESPKTKPENLKPSLKGGDADDAGVVLARALCRQIERESSQSAFWVVSILSKMNAAGCTLQCALNIVRQEMKKSAADYDHYIRTT